MCSPIQENRVQKSLLLIKDDWEHMQIDKKEQILC